jgi:hypothetical protein
MFRGRRGSRTADGMAALSVVAAGQIVWDAEGTVRQAWAHELLRQQSHLEFARSAASQDRDTALECLAAAQRDGEPRKISAAHAVVEQALEAVRQSSLACDRIRRSLRVELDLQARAAKERAVASLVRQLALDGSVIAASREQQPRSEAGETGSVSTVRGSGRRSSRWPFRLLVARRTAGLWQS